MDIGILIIPLIHSCRWQGLKFITSYIADQARLRNVAWTHGQNEAYSISTFSISYVFPPGGTTV